MSQPIVSGIAKLYCNELNSDIKFVIESENKEFPAHKLVIGIGSDVLHRMVYGSGTTLGSTTIVVPRFSSINFLVVLKYLYTGVMEWNLDNYNTILEVGDYFGLTELKNLFNGFLADTINYSSALDIYGRYYHENNIVCRTAMKVIQLVLARYLKSDLNFFELATEAVVQILRMDELGICESNLFERLIDWAELKGYESVSPVLGNLVNLIRFASMADLNDGISAEFK